MNDPLTQMKPNQTPPDWESWEISPQEAPRIFYTKPRRKMLPLVLFLLTCLSTFWVGVCQWTPNLIEPLWNVVWSGSLLHIRELLLANWSSGLIYMICVLTILLLHEFGHFFATIYYRVPASFPYFLPFPFNPLGTLGAVIGMQGNAADRKQIFDIGIAGPLAGLVAAVPIVLWCQPIGFDRTRLRRTGVSPAATVRLVCKIHSSTRLSNRRHRLLKSP